MYRVDCRATAMLDNTAVLTPALGLTEAQWAVFVSPHFVCAPRTSLGDLEQAVSDECPYRADELSALAAAHLHLHLHPYVEQRPSLPTTLHDHILGRAHKSRSR